MIAVSSHSMTPEQKADKLDAGLKDEQDAIAKLQSTVAESKEASEDLKDSLERLEEVTKQLEEEHD